ncbi:MAG: O-antigen ligase family protein, partial [Candidatus Saccharibacteria bacterium]|nr:O-antigen ligase family protein [Candidatus Saccharibacteria bacterium]
VVMFFDFVWGFKLRKVGKFLKEKWAWLLFPIFVSLSILWTGNLVRGILTVGILWLIYFAGFAIFTRKKLLNAEFWRKFLKWFFGAGLFACAWCLVQCILDIAGVSREVSLMCVGCTTQMFGFPHPNGFAIEPQFMGNLLLAPAIVSAVLVLKKKSVGIPLFLIFVAGLFLTFSRGAIYAFIVAMIFLIAFEIMRTKKMRALVLVLISCLAFLFTLNLQGIFAQVSKTNDTYLTGVTKVLNHLSLGIIDIPIDKNESEEIAEGPVVETEDNDAVFDGYVEESTNIRVGLTESAMRVWSRNFSTMMFGVGIGGAGEAMFKAGEIGSPKEIVQNEYVSLLLEVGLVGVLLCALTVFYILRTVWRNEKSEMVFALIFAYAISLLFFSGLPNALQIYLLPVVFYLSTTSPSTASSSEDLSPSLAASSEAD